MIRDNHIWFERQNVQSEAMDIMAHRPTGHAGVDNLDGPVWPQPLLNHLLQNLGPGLVLRAQRHPKGGGLSQRDDSIGIAFWVADFFSAKTLAIDGNSALKKL